MADPLTLATTWVISTITAKAIEAAQNFAKKQAEDFYKQHLAAQVVSEFAQLENSLKDAIQRSSDQTVQKIAGNIFAIEMTKIQNNFSTWASEWKGALEKQRKGDPKRMNELLKEFLSGEASARSRLNLLHNLLMGTGGFSAGDSAGGYIENYEAGLYMRLSDEKDLYFHTRHYYASIKLFLVKIIRVQLLGCYFYRCANGPGTETDDMVAQVQDNINEQKQKLVKLMPPFIRRIKPSFEEPAKPDHWWQFSMDGGNKCLTIKDTTTWYNNHTSYIIYDNITPAAPRNEWRFQPPLLSDDEPVDPSTYAERYASVANRDDSKLKAIGPDDQEFTCLISRLTQLPLFFSGLRVHLFSKGGTFAGAPVPLHCKIVPLKNMQGKPAFKVIGVQTSSSAEARVHKYSDGVSEYKNPFKEGKEFALQDNSTSQTWGKPEGPFTVVYDSFDFGPFSLLGKDTRAFAFDFNHTGKLDHVVAYTPMYAGCIIFRPRTTFRPVFWSKPGLLHWGTEWLRKGDGIGGFDLLKAEARMFAYDYDHSGRLDYLACYEPGHGTFVILKHGTGTDFTEVYRSNDGIGGYNMRPAATHCFAFDYDSSGKRDHIVLYEPGSGTFWIVKHGDDNHFSAVYSQGSPGKGIADCALNLPTDRAFAYDFRRTGRLDHIVITSTGAQRSFSIIQNDGGTFSTILRFTDGVAGFDMTSPLDRFFPVDMEGSAGNAGQLVCYRPSKGAFWLFKQENDNFTPMYTQGDPGNGVAGFDFKWDSDRAIAVDYSSTGKLDHVVCFRTDTGMPPPSLHVGEPSFRTESRRVVVFKLS